MTHCSMTGMGDVSPVRGIGVFNDGDTGTVTIIQEKFTKSLLERYGMASFK